MSINMIKTADSIYKSNLNSTLNSQSMQSDDFVRLFLSQVLNLEDASYIINQGKYKECKQNQDQREFLPSIQIPRNIWLNDELNIKEIKVKTLMIQELNQLVESEITGNNAIHKTDDASLEYYEKLFSAYGFYELNIGSNFSDDYDATLTLREEQGEEEEESSNGGYNYFDDRGTANRHNSIASVTSRSSSTLKSSNRFSISSRDNNKIRFSNILNLKEVNYQSAVSQSNTAPEEDPHGKQQALNGLLAKSKLYNKIRRNRESISSNSSNISYPSNYSNRNSISTTNTTTSSISRRRTSSIDINDTKKYFPRMSQVYASDSFSPMQRQENQKNKYSYYIECSKLLDSTKSLLSMGCDSENVTRLLRFINKKVLKFIILDVQQMIIDYSRMKAYGNFRGC